jgi:RES domain-containing protein
MRVWRLATSLFPPLNGEGARLRGGRWNSPGTPVVYASAHLSLAILELLVHVDPADLPDNLVSYEIVVPDDAVEELDENTLAPAWRTDLHVTRDVGDRWARASGMLALGVPSVIVPGERNYLLNPAHPDAAQLRVVSSAPFAFDERLGR